MTCSKPLDIHLNAPESPDTAANELFVHGLLEFQRHDTQERRDTRVQNVLAEIQTPRDAAASHRHLVRLRRWRRVGLSIAAMLVLAGSLSVFFATTTPSASALVQASLASSREVPWRRYEVRRAAEQDAALASDPDGTLDLSTDDRFVLRIFQGPNGVPIIGGHSGGVDGKGIDWAIRPDQTIDTDHPREAWPRWMMLADDTLFGSPDEILGTLGPDYIAQVVDSGQLDGIPHYHIHASKKPSAIRRTPQEIDVWIDCASKVVDVLELRWSREQREFAGPPGGGGNGGRPDRRPEPRDGFPHGPRDQRDPRGGGGGGGDPPDDDRPPPRQDPFGPPGPGGGPDGPLGVGGGGPGRGPAHPRPPALLRLNRVACPDFADSWFEPGTHAKSSR